MGRDPQYLAFLRRRLAAAQPPARSLQEARRAHAADLAASPRVPAGHVRDLTITGPGGPLPARLYRPRGPAPRPVLVYLHGGGWVLGDVDAYDPVVRALAAASGVAWVSVGYRRPPEHPFPAAVDDAVAALAWVRGNAAGLGVDPGRAGVAGDSAGGQIAAAAALRLRGTAAAPALQLLVYPALDLRAVPPDPPDPDGLVFARGGVEQAVRAYLAGADPALPEASPLLAPDLAGLPPAIVAAAGHDRLRPQAEHYAARLRAAGVPVTELTAGGLDHGFLGWGSFARVADEAIGRIGAAVRTALTG
ncbi:alpha/beta hydrolase [Actinomadura macrotermitis]|uniref:Carboxylesterase NlhH n=1 Tax=Actinomadura macrotermitis TaxID=2585200 RepID=A0A7K0C7J0_9ACTN|nr:alpha/beta hydrolase [Actinomadura macrotermitis]MQY08744.1 Carboxylesterase NlhH [Actinomadura macrotermitis]